MTTLSLTPDLLVATVHQYVRWASVTGLRRLVFVNAHLGNAASLGVATDSVRLLAPQLRVGTLDWWAADPAVLAEVTADGADIHANRAETAIMMAIAPHLVHAERAADADDPDRTAGLAFRYTAPALSRNGVTGRPSQASADLGAELRRRVVAAIAGRTRWTGRRRPASRPATCGRWRAAAPSARPRRTTPRARWTRYRSSTGWPTA